MLHSSDNSSDDVSGLFISFKRKSSLCVRQNLGTLLHLQNMGTEQTAAFGEVDQIWIG